MKSGEYDGVSASGNASARLVAADLVDPVNVDLVPNYKTVFSDLKDQPYNTFDGQPYGIPHGRGANLLMWNSDDVKPAPDLLGRDARPQSRVQVQRQDQRLRRPDLHRRRGRLPEVARARPGDRKPLRAQRRAVRSGGRPAEGTAAQRRRILVGSGEADLRLRQRRLPRSAPPGSTSTSPCRKKATPVAASPASQGFLPKEGATGWSDTWMISSAAKHPNCMYEWMNWIIEPKVNAEVAEFFGEAPAQSLACDETADKNFCAKYHAETRRSGSGSTTGRPRWPTAATAKKTARTTTTGSRPGPRSRASRAGRERWRLKPSWRRGRWAAGSPASSTAAPACRWGRCWPARSAGW